MRFAGDFIQKYTGDSDVSDHGRAFQHNYKRMQQKPVVPSFNPEDLIPTPEMNPGPYYPGQDLKRDQFIRKDPRSGVS